MWVSPPNEKSVLTYSGDRRTADLFSEPNINSRKVGAKKLVPRQEYSIFRTIEVTVTPGAGVVGQNLRLEGRDFGPVNYISTQDYYVQSNGRRFTSEVRQGTAVRILSMDLREGTLTCYFRINGDILEVSHRDDYLVCLPPPFEQKQPPQVEIWSTTGSGKGEDWFIHERDAFHAAGY